GTGLFQGASVSVGTASQAGSLILSDGSSNTVTISTEALGGNYVVSFPTEMAANDTFCLETLGNCVGGGGGVTSLNTLSGALTIQGTTNKISITDNSSDTITVTLPNSVVLGDVSNAGTIALSDGTGDTTTLQAGNSAGSISFTLPTTTGSQNQCLKNSATPGILT